MSSMKRLFFVLLLIVITISTTNAQDLLAPDEVTGDVYYIPFPVAIEVDGKLDDWAGVPIASVNRGPTLSDNEAENGPFTFAVAANTETIYITMTISDQTTVNLHHDRATILRGVIAQGWVRQLASKLVSQMSKVTDVLSVNVENLYLHEGFWIVPPEAMAGLKHPGVTLMPVNQTCPTGLLAPKIGVLVIPEQFGVETKELFDRWTVSAFLEFRLWWNLSHVECLNVTGLEYHGYLV